MPSRIVKEDSENVVIELTIPKNSCFLSFEENLQNELNHAGRQASHCALAEFDVDGDPILIGNTKFTAKKKKVEKKYETPFGPVEVSRFVFQSSAGGAVHIPLEHNARIFGKSTPRFAKIVSSKYSCNNAATVQQDLEETLHRKVSRCFIQDISTLVASKLEEKSALWDLKGDEPPGHQVAAIGIGLDGVCMLFCEDGYRQAMVGTITFYDAAADRLHTSYVASAPEYGKASFLAEMDREIARIKEHYPDVCYVGISDGATDFRPWLERHTTTQVLDFWHLTEYLAEAARAMFPRVDARKQWLRDALHKLKHTHGAAAAIVEEIQAAMTREGLAKTKQEALETVLGYMSNNIGRTNYASYRKRHLPIGSGVTEAACKVVVKQRMCGSGMKWKFDGARTVLALRSKRLTKGAWGSFWAKVGRIGI